MEDETTVFPQSLDICDVWKENCGINDFMFSYGAVGKTRCGEKRGKCEHQREKIVDKFGFDSVYLSIFSFCLFWYVAWFRFGWVVFFIWHAGENWSKFKVGEIRTDARENDEDEMDF